jgi:CubicO group peptidase (beta-lactamase class C family)
MPAPRKFSWLWLLAAPFILIPLLFTGVWVFMATTATNVHPTPESIPSQPTTQTAHQATIESNRLFLRGTLKEQNIPALSIAVAQDNQIVWTEAFGYADTDKKSPATPQTKFRIGTASIPLTAAALALLLDESKLKLDDDIRTHVSTFPDKGKRITIRHLMANLSGLPRDGGDESELYAATCQRPLEAVKIFEGLDLISDPGTKFRLSTYGWVLLAAAAESAAKTPFHTFLQQRLFTLLEMKDTFMEMSPTNDRASSYFPRFSADTTYGLDPVRDLNFSCYLGAAGIISTPTDLVRFLMAFQNNKLFASKTVEALQTNQPLPNNQESGYGLGWAIESITINGKPTKVIFHNGDILGGMASTLLSIPTHNLHIAIAANTSYSDTYTIATTIAQSFASPTKK